MWPTVANLSPWGGADVIPTKFLDAVQREHLQGAYGMSVTIPNGQTVGDGANQIFLDGQMMIEARWPNTTLDVSHPTLAETSGSSYIDSGTGLWTGTITDPNQPSRPA